MQLDEIYSSKVKPKELVLLLAQELIANKKLLGEMISNYAKARDSIKGADLSALAHITKDNPKFVADILDFIIDQINHKAPRVKWESSEIIANVAKEYPEKVEGAIPSLIQNTNDEGTVVRWSAAFALTEIAKSNPKTRKQLVPIFEEIVEKEENNGVKNIYLKALKLLAKTK
jgi:hypothetical protein